LIDGPRPRTGLETLYSPLQTIDADIVAKYIMSYN